MTTQEELKKMFVPELKTMMKARGLKLSKNGKAFNKQELINKILNHDSQNKELVAPKKSITAEYSPDDIDVLSKWRKKNKKIRDEISDLFDILANTKLSPEYRKEINNLYSEYSHGHTVGKVNFDYIRNKLSSIIHNSKLDKPFKKDYSKKIKKLIDKIENFNIKGPIKNNNIIDKDIQRKFNKLDILNLINSIQKKNIKGPITRTNNKQINEIINKIDTTLKNKNKIKDVKLKESSKIYEIKNNKIRKEAEQNRTLKQMKEDLKKKRTLIKNDPKFKNINKVYKDFLIIDGIAKKAKDKFNKEKDIIQESSIGRKLKNTDIIDKFKKSLKPDVFHDAEEPEDEFFEPENAPTVREQNIQLIKKKLKEKPIEQALLKRINKGKIKKIVEGNLNKKLKDKDYNYFKKEFLINASESDINDLKNVLTQQVKTLKNYYSKEDITPEQKNNMLDELKFINRYKRELREGTAKGEKTADYEYFYNIVKDYTKTELKDMKKYLIKKAQNKYTLETERTNILDELKYLNRILSEKK
jgi:hypothetical protein